jgi:hypothetical protein
MVSQLSPEERAHKLAEALALLEKGVDPVEIAERLELTRATIYSWRSKHLVLACKRCAEQTTKPMPTGLCPFCIGELREEAIKALVAHQGAGDFELAQRTKAISALRDLGYTQQEVLQVRARAVDGHSAEEIVEWLCGEEREAVAV